MKNLKIIKNQKFILKNNIRLMIKIHKIFKIIFRNIKILKFTLISKDFNISKNFINLIISKNRFLYYKKKSFEKSIFMFKFIFLKLDYDN
jgi:hypothetical protein